jgi:hypothetical protein
LSSGRSSALVAALAASLVAVAGGSISKRPPTAAAAPGPRSLPGSFERNAGQTDRRVLFLARSGAGTLFLTRGDAVLAGRGQDVLRLRLAHARPATAITGAQPLAGRANYIGGPSRVATYGAVVYHSVYAGVDLRYHLTDGRLEYDFDLAPGADPTAIAVDLRGARRVRIDPAGDLELQVGSTRLLQLAPRVYQQRTAIGGRYVVHGRTVGFALGPYDRRRALVIDPAIAYTTRLDGGGADAGRAIAADGHGDAFVTGETSSVDFPTVHPIRRSPRGSPSQAFVTKLGPTGAVVYSTYLGGSRYSSGRGIAVDAKGSAYVTGATNSTDFPTTAGALQLSYGGGPFDAFVSKLDPSGAKLVYSTLLGDTHYDEGNAIAVDARGRAVVTGRTVSPDFASIGGLRPHVAGGAFVARLNASGTRLGYSAVFGGDGAANHGNIGFGVAVDRAGDAYATGVTNAAGLPTSAAVQPAIGGGSDAFAIKIDAAGRHVVYCTFLGGSGDEIGRAIAADSDGNAYVTGQTTSTDFPTARPLQPSHAKGADAFVTKIDPSGGALVFSTYLGGGGDDVASAIAVDRARDVEITGRTTSTDLSLTHATQHADAGGADAFVAEIDRTGARLLRSSYLGGRGDDAGLGIAVDRAGTVFVTGQIGAGGRGSSAFVSAR